MGSGTSGALLAPIRAHEGGGEPSDGQLVAAVRNGDDRAFELLYERYHRRIHAYVRGMVRDHGRAEDVTQEVFVSALRRMRETERPIAFKPWAYEIARNACIDAYRRSRRAEEVSFDAHDALAPGDHRRLVGTGPTPDAALAAKQELENLWGAFGGLSETHHEILVLRELEGLSYREIGERMGMSRSAVESTLFRARRRLTEEYDDLISGARCRRIQSVIHTAADGVLGARDARRLARHLAHCQPCRREAVASGLDAGVLVQPRKRLRSKVAAWLPLPGFLRVRLAGDSASGFGSGAATHLSALSDQLSGGWGKLAAAAAVLLAGAGAGVGMSAGAGAKPERPAKPAAVTAGDHAAAAAPRRTLSGRIAARQRTTPARHGARTRGVMHRRATAGGSHIRRTSAAPAAGGAAPTGGSAPAPSGGSQPTAVPAPETAAGRATAPVTTTTRGVSQAVQDAGTTVEHAAEDPTGAVQQAAGAVPQAAGAVPQAAGAVQQAAGAVPQAAQQTVGTAGQLPGGLVP